MSSLTTFVGVMKFESNGNKLDDRVPAFVQVAVLHTTAQGERRVRLLNMTLGVSSMIGNIFRFADLDAAVTVFIKGGMLFSVVYSACQVRLCVDNMY